MKSIIGYLLLAIIVATVIGFSINAFSKSQTVSNSAEQLNTPLPTLAGNEPTESGCPQEGHIKSPSSFNKASVTFDNQTAADLKIYWIDFQGNRKFYSNLKAHTKYDQATWIGHVWVVADASGKCLKLESANAISQDLVID